MAKAQIVKEIFQQKQTQIEYLANQIAALKVYIEVLQKGYKIADQGLTLIGKLKDSDFKLHKDYFASLKKVKPLVKNYPRVQDIIDLQMLTVQTYRSALSKAIDDGLLTASETSYMQRVYQRLISDCDKQLGELTAVVTDDKLEMKDDERIKRIDQLFQSMLQNYTFSRGFVNSAIIMGASRKKGIQSANTIEELVNIK